MTDKIEREIPAEAEVVIVVSDVIVETVGIVVVVSLVVVDVVDVVLESRLV